jgi:hypothetical protein
VLPQRVYLDLGHLELSLYLDELLLYLLLPLLDRLGRLHQVS